MDGMALGLILSTLAGLATVVGAALGMLTRQAGPRVLSLALGFSGGVMLHVSYVELLGSAMASVGFVPAHIAFFVGMGAMFAVDALIPHDYFAEHATRGGASAQQLAKTGLFVALGIGIHNFPEGMLTLAGTLQDPKLGFAIAAAVAIHNIPEGLAVAAPILAATGSRRRAFAWASLSGMAEPIGAGIAAAVLLPFLSTALLGYVLAAVAGIMVFIALDELVPVSRELDRGHWAILGVIAGLVVMAGSLALLA
ncbi:MAG: zinc transporter ZupT [Candidatus Bipolaricaulota bacterium]